VLPDTLAKRLAERMTGKVRIAYVTQEVECRICSDVRQLVEDIGKSSDKVEVDVLDFRKDESRVKELGVDKIPAIALSGERDYGIRFYGVPAGYQLPVLVDTITDVSSGQTALSEDARRRLRDLTRSVHIQVFTMTTCPYCPTMVRAANRFAIESRLVRADMVEAGSFPHLTEKYNIMSVPKTVINESLELSGVIPEEQFVRYLAFSLGPPSTLYV